MSRAPSPVASLRARCPAPSAGRPACFPTEIAGQRLCGDALAPAQPEGCPL